MVHQDAVTETVPRIEYLGVKNYRALKNLELKGLTPLTVFLGPNGSGKSTVFDVFAFLSECFSAVPCFPQTPIQRAPDPRFRRPHRIRTKIPRAAKYSHHYIPLGH